MRSFAKNLKVYVEDLEIVSFGFGPNRIYLLISNIMTKSIERCQKRTKRIRNVLNNLLLQGISISFLTVTRHSLNPPSPPTFHK